MMATNSDKSGESKKVIRERGGGGGEGMSRAAKKRAKKKQRQHKNKKQQEESRPSSLEQSKDKTTGIHNSKKRPLPEEESQEQPDPPKHARTNITKRSLIEESKEVDETIQTILSKLTPLQILQLADMEETEQRHNDGDNNNISVSDVLREATTQQRAHALFQSLLGPTVSTREFHDKYWEQQPLYIAAGGHETDDKKSRFDGFLSKQGIRELLDTQPTYYGRDLNVTRYDKGIDGVKRRQTLDPQPDPNDDDVDFVLVDAKDVWENYQLGCSVRLLCPHKHNDALHALLSTLEWEFGCMVGANVYLTPRSSQGFAPHYDDIEAFCLQLEGYKHWKVYAPFNKAETLARTSSSDYSEDDLKDVEPVLDVVMGPGDLLYMPRGWIHQACTTDRAKDGDSLHLTISAMQQWAWADLLELLLPEALEATASSSTSTSLREGLPLRFLDYMGTVHDNTNQEDLPQGLQNVGEVAKNEKLDDDEEDSDDEASRHARQMKALRDEFRGQAKKRIMRVSKEALSMLDAACDQIGKRFISDRLPPALTATESQGTSERQSGAKIWPNTLVRLVRPGIARLALEDDDKAVIYHCVDNSRVYHGNPLSPMEFEMDDAPALELLLTTVEPHWVQVQDLIHDDIEDKVAIAQSLYDEGILAILQTDMRDESMHK